MTKNNSTCFIFRKIIFLISSILVAFSLFFFIGNTEAKALSENGISIVVPNKTSQYMSVVQKVQNGFKDKNIEILNLSNFKQTLNVNLDNQELVILVGSKSFDYYVKTDAKSPYLTTLITKSAFKFIYNKSKNKNKFVGGISIDQPSWRFVSLAQALLPTLKKTALVYGPEKTKYKNTVLKELNKFNLDYDVLEISLNDNPVNKLRNAYESNEALILFPDRKKFNQGLSRWVLTLSYQYKIPVISYSKKYAQAGALASLFTTPEQIGAQTTEIVVPFLKNPNNKPRKLIDPKYFDIYVNRSVANALNLAIPSKFELLQKITN